MEEQGSECFCVLNGQDKDKSPDQKSWMIECDVCHVWFHGDCVKVSKVLVPTIEKFHCPKCEPLCGPSISKPVTNSHRYDPTDPEAGTKSVQIGTRDFLADLVRRESFAADSCVLKEMSGYRVNKYWLERNGFNAPVKFFHVEGLGLSVPAGFGTDTLLDHLDPDRSVEVIDVYKQGSVEMALRDFLSAYGSPSPCDPLNSLSLEISDTPLDPLISAPNLVRELCWIQTLWKDYYLTRSASSSSAAPLAPKVRKYCILSMANSYTDFHIDFGGSSVWYHMVSGVKRFYLFAPSTNNVANFERWHKLHNQSEIFLPDMMGDACFCTELTAGQTLLIPTGWIHAVYTAENSVVVGGNFLHSLNIPLQLRLYEMEERLHTPYKFRFPYFETLHWLLAAKYREVLKEKPESVPDGLKVDLKQVCSVLKGWLKKETSGERPGELSQSRQNLPPLPFEEIFGPKGALLKAVSRCLKQTEKKGQGGSIVIVKKDLPKIKLTLHTKPLVDLTDRNSVRSLLHHPVTLNEELQNAMDDFGTDLQPQQQPQQRDEDDEERELQVDTSIQSSPSTSRRAKRSSRAAANLSADIQQMRQVYQDDEFIYPSLDISDEEAEVLAKQEKGKDLNWKPKARVKSLERRSNRPAREGAKKIHLEKGLEEVSKRLENKKAKKSVKPKSSNSSGKSNLKRTKSKEPLSVPAPTIPQATAASPGVLLSRAVSGGGRPPPTGKSKMSSAPKIPKVPSDNKVSKPKSKNTTAKQRLGKLLKLKF